MGKRTLIFILVSTFITVVAVTGCMDEKKDNTSEDSVKAAIIDDLQLQYGKNSKS